MNKDSVLVKHVALPQDHGSWVFLFSPLLIGLFAGGRLTVASGLLILAAMAGFMIRQPVTTVVKAYSGRRSHRDLPPARFWIGVYGAAGLVALVGLWKLGFGYLLALALLGIPIFAWHLYLVSQRQERRQMLIEILGSGVLALAAPAAYWVGRGEPDPRGWLLLGLAWLQSASSIVYAYLRLKQRTLPAVPEPAEGWRLGAPAFLFAFINLLLCAGLALTGQVPALLTVPYGLQLAETAWGITHPAVGYKPAKIGYRQLAISSLFTLLFIAAW